MTSWTDQPQPFARIMHGDVYVRPGEVVKRHTREVTNAKADPRKRASDTARTAGDPRSDARDLQGGVTGAAQLGTPVCAWYALCDHGADGTVSHPVLGDVPTCRRCADKHALDLVPYSAPTNGAQL